MWTAKLEISVKGSEIAKEAKKANVTLTGYPISYHETRKSVLMEATGRVIGEKKNILAFVRNMKKNKSVKRFYVYHDFCILLIELPKKFAPLYRPEIIWLKPALVTHESEIAEVASWDKRYITDMIKCFGNECRILKLKKGVVKNISVTTSTADITDKQKKALKLAINSGYYCFPKKIELKDLAKMMHISYSTYQAHLKKAESRVMPSVMNTL